MDFSFPHHFAIEPGGDLSRRQTAGITHIKLSLRILHVIRIFAEGQILHLLGVSYYLSVNELFRFSLLGLESTYNGTGNHNQSGGQN